MNISLGRHQHRRHHRAGDRVAGWRSTRRRSSRCRSRSPRCPPSWTPARSSSCRSRSPRRAWARPPRMRAWPRSRGPWRRTGTSGSGRHERVAAFVDVRQHPDLLRAGVLTLPSGALNDVVTDEGASITVTPLPPITAGHARPGRHRVAGRTGRPLRARGADLDVRGRPGRASWWPPWRWTGRHAHGRERDHRARRRTCRRRFEIPDLKVGYRIRVIVDRKLRSDVSRERPIVLDADGQPPPIVPICGLRPHSAARDGPTARARWSAGPAGRWPCASR